MKYIPPFRIELDAAFEYSESHRAYIFYATKLSIGQEEWRSIQKKIALYDKAYDKTMETLKECNT